MFDNLTKEIFIYSAIPAGILALIVLILLLVGKKKDNNIFKYNYFIKILLILIIGLVLPLITGYTIWVFERFSNQNTLSSNWFYLVLLILLIIALIGLLITICKKLINGIKNSNDQEYSIDEQEELVEEN